MSNCRLLLWLLVVTGNFTVCRATNGQATAAETLLHDDFDGKSLDQTKWRGMDKEAYWFAVSDGNLLVHYNTYNVLGPDRSPPFHTPILETVNRFGPGVVYEAKLRMNDPPPGLNAAFFVYESEPDSADKQDEIDYELITVDVKKVWLQTFVDLKAGVTGNHASPGNDFDMRKWNTFQIVHRADNTVVWKINGKEVRPEKLSLEPNEQMRAAFTYWRPLPSWKEAYVEGFEQKYPAKDISQNRRWTMDVDYLTIRKIRSGE